MQNPKRIDYHSAAEKLFNYAQWLINEEEERLSIIQNRHKRNMVRCQIVGMKWLLSHLKLYKN